MLAWHGCSPEATRSICAFGAVDLRKVDGGTYKYNTDTYIYMHRRRGAQKTKLIYGHALTHACDLFHHRIFRVGYLLDSILVVRGNLLQTHYERV